MADRCAIEATGLRLSYRRPSIEALCGVDLFVGSGESIALLGANGAGKSTLLRILAGVRRPDRGRVVILGRDPADRGGAGRQPIGFLPADGVLPERLRIGEFFAAWARLQGCESPRRRADSMLRWLQLEAVARRPIAALSHGQRRRVALGRALIHDPAVLLLDEPFIGLDTAAADRVTAFLNERSAVGATLLVATHDSDRSRQWAGRTVTLRSGRCVPCAAGDRA